MPATVVVTMMMSGLSGVGALALMEAARRHVVGVRLDRELRHSGAAGPRESQ